MKNVIAYDENPNFISNVQRRMEINQEYPFNLRYLVQSHAKFQMCMTNNKNELDAILINLDKQFISANQAQAYGLPVISYSTKNTDDDEIGTYLGIYKYGDEERFINDVLTALNDNSDTKKEPEEEVEEEVEKETKETTLKEEPEIEEEEEPIKKETAKKESKQEEETISLSKDEYLLFKELLKEKQEKKSEDKLREKMEEAPEEPIQKKGIETELISVYSGKGGTGKSTIASQLSIALAQHPRRRGFAKVCLIDLDFRFGDVSNLFNLPETDKEPLDELIFLSKRQEKITLEDLEGIALSPEGLKSISTEDSLKIIPAPADLNASKSIKIETIGDAIEALKSNNIFDYIICDCGNNLNKAVLSALISSDRILMVYTPDFTTIRDNDSAMNALNDDDIEASQGTTIDGKCKAIINKASSKSGLESSNISDAIPIDTVAVISYDEDITMNNNFRVPTIFDENSKFYAEFMPIVKEITGEDFELPEGIEEEPKEKRGFFSRLFKRKG